MVMKFRVSSAVVFFSLSMSFTKPYLTWEKCLSISDDDKCMVDDLTTSSTSINGEGEKMLDEFLCNSDRWIA